MEIKETAGAGGGAGYSDEQIDGNSGVAGVRAAYNGYNPDDGTYVSKGNLSKRRKIEILPTDTDDELTNRTNAMYNDSQAYALTDSRLRQVMAQDNLQFGEPTRAGMDYYMMSEYGNSRYDDNPDILTSEYAKDNRAQNEFFLAPALQGQVRFAARTLATAVTLPMTIANNIAELFGSDPDALNVRRFTDWTDDRMNDIKKFVPQYDTQAEEEAAQQHPIKYMFTTGGGLSEMMDNFGYTAGAALIMMPLGPAAAPVSAGLAALDVATAVKKAVLEQEAAGNKWYENMGPLAAAVAAAAITAKLPKGLQNGVKMLATSAIAATGEAETETAHAVNEFIREKSDAIDANISARKGEVVNKYNQIAGELMTKMDMALPEEKERIRQELEDLAVDMDNELKMLDWQRTKAVNEAIKNSDSTANITRLANYAILTASNTMQFGKLLTGGFKRYATQTTAKALDEAMDYAGKRYAKVQAEAGGDILKQAQNRWNKKKIIQEGLAEYSEKTGKKVLDERKTLSAFDYVKAALKNPLVEGAEEMKQGMASNAGKAYAERNTDDYYGQISGLDAFRRSESAVMAAAKAAGNTLLSEQAWSEFLAGALTGALGMPSIRNPRFKRATGEMDANGNLVETRHWRSPIYFQGGVYGEIRKAKFDMENRGRMAEEINKYLSPEGRKNWQRRMANMAHHMQYQDDKERIVGLSNGKDKYHWENAEDAELVKTVELFQQTGQMDLLKAFARTELDYETADELRNLQQRTMTVDKNGDKVGRYTEFDLADPGENASEAQKKHLEDEMSRMKEKIKTDVNRRLEAIDLYAEARRKLQQESQQGLSAEAMNVLAWYGTRIGLFDKRTESMFNEHEGDLNALNKVMEGFFKERHAEINANLAEISKARGASESLTEEQRRKLDADEKKLLANRETLTLAEEEWKERWERAGKVDSPLGRAKVLFTGNEEADPIGGSPAKKPWYLPDKVWARRINGKQSEASRRRAALMGVSLARSGSEGMLFTGVLDAIIDDMSGDEVSSQVLRDAFPDADARKSFAAALHDMRECQAAIVRYKDLYQFYKDNPYAAEARAKEAGDKFDSMAAQATIQQAVERLKKCETVKAMYEEVVKMVKEGYDTDFLNGAIKSLAKEGSEVAKAFLENQDFLQVFCAAVDSIAPLSENGTAVGSKLGHVVLKEIAIEAASECDDVATMHGYIEKRLGEVLASPEAFAAFVYEKGIVDTSAMTQEEFAKSMATASARVVLNKDGQFVNELQGTDGTAMTQDRMKALRSAMPRMLEAVDGIIKEKLWKKQKYSFGEHVDWPETNAIAVEVAKAQAAEAEAKHAAFQARLAEIGGGTYDPVSGETVKAIPDSDVRGEQQPEAPLDGDSALDNGHEETADEANRKNIEWQVKEQEDDGRPKSWIPALSFFNMKFKKLGRLVRNKFIRIANGVETRVDNPGEGSFTKFWNTMEKLGVWDFVDGTPKDSDGALRKGEPVYFVVDKADPATGKTRMFGLDADEVAYNGTPIVFMCVKRGGKYQCIGTMPTSRAKLERDGQLAAWESIVTAASQTEGVYIHSTTGALAGVHQGLVETQDSENTLDKVCGGADNVVLAIKTHSKGKDGSLVAVSKQGLKIGQALSGDIKKTAVVHVLVKDNATGRYIPMPCRIAHFSKEDEARLGQTATWKKALSAIDAVAQAVAGVTSLDSANKALTPAYVKLCGTLSMQGYGVHINVIQDKLGRLMLSVSKPRYSDEHAIELRDETGEVMYQKDKDGNLILDENGNKMPLKERIFTNIPLDGSADVAAWLRDTLMSDDFSVPFRVSVNEMANDNQYATQLITDGVITANIADGGGVHTRGCYAQVDYGKTEEREVDPELEHKESPLDDVKKIGKSVLKNEGDKVSLNGRVLEGEERALALNLIKDKVEHKAFAGKTGDYVIVKDELKCYQVYEVNDGGFYLKTSLTYKKDWDSIVSLAEAEDEIRDAVNRAQVKIPADSADISRLLNYLHDGERIKDAYKALLYNSELRTQFLGACRTAARFYGDKVGIELCDTLNNLAEMEVEEATRPAQPQATQEARQSPQEVQPQEAAQSPQQEESRDESQEAAPSERAAAREESQPVLPQEPAGGEAVEEAAATEESSATDVPAAETVDEAPATPSTPQLAEEPAREPAPVPETRAEGEAVVKTEVKAKREKGKSNMKLAHVKKISSVPKNQSGQDDTKHSIVKPGEATAPRVDVAREVAALRKIVPWLTRDEAIMTVDRLMTVAGKGAVAQGAFKSGLMIISTKGVRGTVFHEAFHSIFRTALDEKTRKDMIEDAKEAYGVTRAAEAEECLADAFRDYMVDQVYEKSWTRRIRDFFDWLLNLLDFSGTERYISINRVFDQINSGAYIDAGRGKFSDVSLRELRIAEYRMLGYGEDQIRFLERQRGSFSTRGQDVRNMIIEAGYSEESFDALSQKDRDEVVACL